MSQNQTEPFISDADRAAHEPLAAPPGAARPTNRWWAALNDPEVYDELSESAQYWVTRGATLGAILIVMLLIAAILWTLGPAPHM